MSAPEGIRTPNLLIRSQMLYPLSYGRMFFSCVADESAPAEARGFEPPVRFKADNSLAVSPIRPLWHASLTFTADPTAYTGATGEGKAQVSDP
jgi:hypothetical protein